MWPRHVFHLSETLNRLCFLTLPESLTATGNSICFITLLVQVLQECLISIYKCPLFVVLLVL